MVRTLVTDGLSRMDRVLALPLLLSAIWIARVSAQTTPPVFHFSTTTGTFDGLLPIGQPFQIKGVIGSDVQAIRVESFGFAGRILSSLQHGIGDSQFCAAVTDARKNAQKSDVNANLGWERSTPNDVEFTVNHPRLYYGRSYVFVLTYYKSVDTVAARDMLAGGFRRMMASLGDFRQLLIQGLTDRDLDKADSTVVAEAQQNGRACGPSVVTKDLQESVGFWTEARKVLKTLRAEMREAIAMIGTRVQMQEQLQVGSPGAQDRLHSLKSSLPPAFLADSGVQRALQRAEASADAGSWRAASQAVESLDGLAKQLGIAGILDTSTENSVDELLRRIRSLVRPLAGDETTLTTIAQYPESIAKLAASRIPVSAFRENISATTALPYSQTMHEALPFLISLDGGLAYMTRFRQLTPALAINIKLNRIDFDDPLDKRVEFSFLVGVNTTTPDDLDPDFAGIFNGSDRALLLTMGARSPHISPLLRVQAGVLVFRQHDADPLSHDLHTKVSFIWGLSMNWDALDFAATLIHGRPTLGAGGL